MFIFFFLPIIGVIIYEYYYYKLYYYNFTDDGAEIRKGVVSRATGHVRYERLQNLYVNQDFLDRIFGLYDVHYETAGETSGIYSHVDGLEKENADKLIQFLNEKAKNSSQTKQVIKNEVVAPKSTINTGQKFSRENCPMSNLVISEWVIGTLFIYLFILVFVYFIFIIKSNGISLALLLVSIPIFIILSIIYWYIWYKNFYFSFDDEKGEIRKKVIGQYTSYIYYDRIQNVNMTQTIWDRMFGLYSVFIETASEGAAVFKLGIVGLKEEDANKLKDFLLKMAKTYKSRL